MNINKGTNNNNINNNSNNNGKKAIKLTVILLVNKNKPILGDRFCLFSLPELNGLISLPRRLGFSYNNQRHNESPRSHFHVIFTLLLYICISINTSNIPMRPGAHS